jgi:hypothetical protein
MSLARCQNPNSRRIKAPNLRRRPPVVSGIPIFLEILDLKAETPMNLQIEKPPRFIAYFSFSAADSTVFEPLENQLQDRCCSYQRELYLLCT